MLSQEDQIVFCCMWQTSECWQLVRLKRIQMQSKSKEYNSALDSFCSCALNWVFIYFFSIPSTIFHLVYTLFMSCTKYHFMTSVLFLFQLFAIAESLGGYESLAEHP